MLNGKKIIITRQAGSGDPIVDALHELGAEVIFMPLIEVFPIASVDELSKNHQKIENYQWLLFTSKNGVQFFFNAYKLEGSKLPFKTGVFGNSTAQALKNLGLTPDLVNNGTSSADLLAEILPKLNKTDKVLLVLGNLASDLLQDGLRQVVKTD